MARIVHIALKVDDLEKATEFYEKGFGFVEMETGQVRDHTSRHLTDGTIDLALIKYDSEDSARSARVGIGPLHPSLCHRGRRHEGFGQAQLQKFGCEIISDPGVIPIKFRAPGGTVAEIVPKAQIQETKRTGVMEYRSTGVLVPEHSLRHSEHSSGAIFLPGDSSCRCTLKLKMCPERKVVRTGVEGEGAMVVRRRLWRTRC